jgi:hypothetical protein
LLSLSEITAKGTIQSRHYLGRQTVPIRHIRGSEGRRNLFDNGFHPRGTQTRLRWISVATAWLQGIGLEPVELIRVGDVYFVRDGHHRISVARAIGLEEIDAIVTVLDVVAAPQPRPRTAWKASWTWARHTAQVAHQLVQNP